MFSDDQPQILEIDMGLVSKDGLKRIQVALTMERDSLMNVVRSPGAINASNNATFKVQFVQHSLNQIEHYNALTQNQR